MNNQPDDSISQEIADLTLATIAAGEKIAVAIDRQTAAIAAATSSSQPKRETAKLAADLEAMVSSGGALSAAPSQTRSVIFAAASVLRRS